MGVKTGGYMEINIDLNDLICDSFVDITSDIINCDVDRAIMKGGRSSTKSQVASESIVVGCMVYKESAVAAVKYANKIEERLVNTFRESIRYLGVEQFWKLRKSPFEYVLLDDKGKETDVSIKFTGCDNPEDLKSYKPRRGSFRYIWFEELTNFRSFLSNFLQIYHF
jgi:phage terminase large subunit